VWICGVPRYLDQGAKKILKSKIVTDPIIAFRRQVWILRILENLGADEYVIIYNWSFMAKYMFLWHAVRSDFINHSMTFCIAEKWFNDEAVQNLRILNCKYRYVIDLSRRDLQRTQLLIFPNNLWNTVSYFRYDPVNYVIINTSLFSPGSNLRRIVRNIFSHFKIFMA